MVVSREYKYYTSLLEEGLKEVYEIARKARNKGLDPCLTPESELAEDLAKLVEGLVGPSGVHESIRELSKKLSREEVAFKIAEEIIYGKFGQMSELEAAEQAIRTALAILTEGITAAPLHGLAKVVIKQNQDHTKYLAIYFSGPIRSAGGTEQALTLVVGDFVRRLLGLDRYKPTDQEIERFIEEVRLFEREISRFQYHISDEELKNALRLIPVEVTGTQSDPVEVSSFRNLPRIETNRIRGGALRVLNDGVIGRSTKVSTIVEKLGIDGWSWLSNIREIEEKKNAGFMEDIIAGRPIFSFPSRRGGFRLRYGRARNTGLAAVGIHPATMAVLQKFVAAGTQLRIELPGKGGIALPVDTIEPPIVRLRSGSIIRVSTKNFEEIEKDIDKILSLGDILISFGDFLYNNKHLLPSGYTEEWWLEDLLASFKQKFYSDIKKATASSGIHAFRLQSILNNPFDSKPEAKEAVVLAKAFGVPLHPSYTYLWSNISLNEFVALRGWLLNADTRVAGEHVIEITGISNDTVKHLLERIRVPHRIVKKNIKIENNDALIFAFCLGSNPDKTINCAGSTFEAIRELTGIILRDKSPTTVGARMGRPEKAKRREMKPLTHLLFPVGLAGGNRRDLVTASNKGFVEVEIINRVCYNCKLSTFLNKCPNCGEKTHVKNFCPRCGRDLEKVSCPTCNTSSINYSKQLINLKALMKQACEKLQCAPKLVKGVKGLINEMKTPEFLEKGILRAKHNLSVFKDGTIRFDATNAPLSHFKPCEIDVSVERLQKMGYFHDVEGNRLVNPDQMCELKLQDVVIPLKCAEYFVHVASFLDELLEKVYKLPPYYEVEDIEELVGNLIVGLAPHTSVGVIGRIVGFTGLSVCYAHPIWHSAKRRDCDGDEDSLMLALDPLLNFSKAYLPAKIGGIMDAPLFLIPVINPKEVQRQAHDTDVASKYPLAFYEKTWQKVSPQEVVNLIDVVGHRLNTEAQFEGFNYTIPVSNINQGNRESMYKRLKRMADKLDNQLMLAEKIDAVDAKKVAQKVLTTHFIRDIAGNLRAYTTQCFRCKRCNKRFRRPPLQGKCPECGASLSLTVYRGGIEKYMDLARRLVKKYDLPDYYAQRLSIIKDEIVSLFEHKDPKQVSLIEYIP